MVLNYLGKAFEAEEIETQMIELTSSNYFYVKNLCAYITCCVNIA